MIDCDLSPHKSIEVNFSKLMDSQQIFRIVFVSNHYHLCEISSHIIECNIFAHYDLIMAIQRIIHPSKEWMITVWPEGC